MDSLFPSFLEGSPGGQVAAVSVAGVLAAVATFALLRSLAAGRSVAPPLETTEAVLDPFTFGSRHDRRMAHRRNGSPLSVQVIHKGAAPIEARVLDRSMGGLGLLSDRDYAPGTTFKARPVSCPPSTPWVELEVRSCQQQGHDWLLGCAFVKTPPYAVLLLFG